MTGTPPSSRSIGVALFDSTLTVDAASIDTGAGGIAGGFALLEVWILARTTEAVDISSVNITVNGDAGANYDRQAVQGADAAVAAGAFLATNAWSSPVPGAAQQVGAVGVIRMSFPAYGGTTFHKTAEATLAVGDDTAANNRVQFLGLRWRNTAAISRMAVAAAAGNLVAGSRLLVMGR